MKIENYYLNLDKINELPTKEEKEQIHRYYMDMLHFHNDNRTSMAISLFNTLINFNYLISIRDEKIEKILNE